MSENFGQMLLEIGSKVIQGQDQYLRSKYWKVK